MKPYKPIFEKKIKDDNTIYIICVGSILLSNNLMDHIEDKPKGFITQKIDKFIQESDVFYGSLRNLFSKKGKPRPGVEHDFRIAPKYVQFIKKLGFSAVNIINNHSFDFGYDPFNDTIISLKKKRMLTIGNPYDPVDTVTVTKKIKKKKEEFDIAFMSYFVQERSYGKKDIITDAYIAKKKSNLVFVSLYLEEGKVIQDEIEFCKKLIDSGADFVLGYSQDKNQNVEVYNNGYIVHSMGNFITDKNYDIYKNPLNGILLEIYYNYKEDKIESVTTRHIDINDEYQPDIIGDPIEVMSDETV